jgi:hypothetical protein
VAADLIYKVAYDEAVRALSEQREAIESVRSRAGMLLSAAAVATSFLGAQALQGGGSDPWAWLALLCFVSVVAASLVILWPRGWEFAAHPSAAVAGRIEAAEEVQIEDLYRDLSLRMHSSYLGNQLVLRHLAAFFQVVSALMTIEVILWVAAIAADL